MCKFFSLVSDGAGKPYYFDYEIRKRIIDGELKYEADSHTSIADYHGFKGKDEDMLNKYEYNPLTKEFTVDKIINKDDSAIIKGFCHGLDFKAIVPELTIHPIVHPFKDVVAGEVTEKEIDLLKQWDSVGDSVGASVWDSVWDSVWASIWAYVSSYFDLKKWKYIDHAKGINPFQPCIDLWNSGFVPTFDGRKWRLHSNKGADIVYEVDKSELI